MLLLNNTGSLTYLADRLTEAVRVVYNTILAIIHVNYDVVSCVTSYCSWILGMVSTFIFNVYAIFVQLLSSATDFITECVRFLQVLVSLLWKFMILILNVLDILFRGIEQVFFFIISGGKWTANAIYESYTHLSETTSALLQTIFTNVKNFAQMSSGAIVMVGTFAYKFIVISFSLIKTCLVTTCEIIDTIMVGLADGIRYVTDSIYYFLVYFLPNLSKETYLGLITVCMFYLFIVNALKLLASRGMTFPLLSQMRRNRYAQDAWLRRNGNRYEFSDDENFGSDNEESENEESEIDDNRDDEDNYEEEVTEFEVTDDSDSDEANSSSDDSNATSTTNFSEIDIQLPPANAMRYNLRRSSTPCSSKINKPEEFERVIEKEREKQKCVVCQDNDKSVLILPCRHMCLCVQCGNHIARSRNAARKICPLCRQRIRTIMNVYV